MQFMEKTKEGERAIILNEILQVLWGRSAKEWGNADGSYQCVQEFESKHPYADNLEEKGSLHFPGASYVEIVFDSATETDVHTMYRSDEVNCNTNEAFSSIPYLSSNF